MRSRFNGLRNQVWELPKGKQQLILMEEAIRLADEHLTPSDAYEARMSYSNMAVDLGYPERLLISFAWCLAEFDRKPGEHSAHTIMWHYKWVLARGWQFPQIATSEIERIFADFKERCLKYGFSLRPYYQQLVHYHLAKGEREEAQRCYKEWKSAKRDYFSDCSACEQDSYGRYYFDLNQNKRGMRVIKPILEGKVSCRSVPQSTYVNMVEPLLKLGQFEEAKEAAKKAVRSLDGAGYLTEFGLLLEYYTLTDMAKAAKLFERTISYGLECRMPWMRFLYFVSVRLFLLHWHAGSRRKKLAAPEYVTLEWVEQETSRLADAFDRRNGNSHCRSLAASKERQMMKLQAAYAAWSK
ncbi:hypothetical protein [Paenibacillus xylaniclasticus]|uniref:hypothetical protein n=1 Tax=Paenibacillus xylaniclasticus TaxID=588083 RepID=UPI000FD8687C|nr:MULTISPECIES: hypothetical protein [Paenibacillus]GFN31497.1 hypothetical protein PCURB6_17570 [Paenibacillus curdlanolyticus]